MKRALLIGGLSVVLLAAALAVGTGWLLYRDDRLPAASTDVIIAQGSSATDVAHQLTARGIISDPTLLAVYFRLHGGGDRILAAEYAFSAHETIEHVALVLAAGGHPPAEWVTIPEGYTAAQIGSRLARANLVSEVSFARAVRARSLVLGGVITKGLEGYLFPDTYLLPKQTTADDVAQTMTTQFQRELPPDALQAARKLHRSIPQIVTIASMIEREAKVDSERPTIASVIYNRLRMGMPLEVDATIEYALPQHKAALSFADLALDSPYNTYKHTGLPPTPISNPGKASLYAAFHPAQTPYLYYVYKGEGHHEFSTTLEQQQANERRYLR